MGPRGRLSALGRHCARPARRAAHCAPADFDPRAAAEAFLSCWSGPAGAALEPISDPALLPRPPSLAAVYAVHDAIAASPQCEKRLGGVGGYKLGWKGARDKFPGVVDAEAVYAPIPRAGFHPAGSAVDLARGRVFCVEAEYGFMLGREVGPRASAYEAADLLAAIARCELCIELCGARQCADPDDPLPLLADAMCGAGVVRGPALPRGTDLAALAGVPVRLSAAGRPLATGSGRANPLDSPLDAVLYLVNDLCVRRGRSIPAGHLIIAGHCCQAAIEDAWGPRAGAGLPRFAARSGAEVRADFEGLGSVAFTVA
eukprot:TRINITY_DN19068_c0_g1_i1.p1 TRINITY_DN19068_c0_g1~~TRINITY_DN19068_c0_g1_i1.p1  ORF type:complete len:327 (+),score=74.55 TRINITY_DN19068_c0_g1_i1:38-982(+)